MAMLNRVELIGNLGADPEIRRTPAGQAICSFTLATSENWRDRANGERRERTEWHQVVIWSEGLIKLCEQHLRKGSRIWLEGKLATRKWTDPEGRHRYATEVVLQGYHARLLMMDRRTNGNEAGGPDEDASGERFGVSKPLRATEEFNDDIPF
jgi:single-strand DNA-binding protein